MNLKYAGNISTFSPKSYMDRSGITMIRPLILLTEKDTNHFVKKYNKQVMPKVCPMDENTKREDIKAEIFAWQKEIPTYFFKIYFTNLTIASFNSSKSFSADSILSAFTPIYNFIFGSVPEGLTQHQALFSNS